MGHVHGHSLCVFEDVLLQDWFSDYPMFVNLREIERRTKHQLESRNESMPFATHWLTNERQDPVWLEYKQLCE
jgi:hypothetical protein